MSITVDTMRNKLHTLDDVRKVLSTTEPLTQLDFPAGSDISFVVEPGWNHSIETLGANDLVDAYVKVGSSQQYRLTKDALLEAGSICGLPKAYVSRSPAHLTEAGLNYWFRDGLSGKEYSLLVTSGVGSAFTKSTITPFSNLRLLDQVLDGITAKYGDGEVLVDYKFNHTLRGTSLRLIVPEYRRQIVNTGTDDDQWSVGVQINNSLIGEGQTEVAGYLFRWWCTNGATQIHDTGRWSRKIGGQGEEVYDWARESVDEVLAGAEHSLDAVQHLADTPLDGDVALIAKDIFDQYRIPKAERNTIIENLVNENNMTMYAIMQSITMAANDVDMDPKHVDKLLRVGGAIPQIADDRCESCRRLIP